MRIAYFSPLPPKRTGIATYSHHLSRALAQHAEIAFFDTGAVASPISGAPTLDYVRRPELLPTLRDYDSVLYHLGNNPHFHLDIYRALLARPGIVVLHDVVLYFLIAGLERGGMLREFLYNYGVERMGEFFGIERDSPFGDVLRYRHPERYPFLRRVMSQATGIVVHSETTANVIAGTGFSGSLRVIPHLTYPEMSVGLDARARRAARKELGVDDTEILVGCFGFIGPPKRFPVLFETLARLKERLPFKLLIVGEGEDIADDIARHDLGDRIIRPGFVDDDRFQLLLKSIDLLVNLRFPSMGEASGPLSQAMAGNIPAIVSDHAWFAELPDEAVCKVSVGEGEAAGLEAALFDLCGNADRRAAVAAAAKRYCERNCAPGVVAQQYIDFIREVADFAPSTVSEPQSVLTAASRGDPGGETAIAESDWLRSYYERRIRQAVEA